MFSEALRAQAKTLLDMARSHGTRLATAESCTGGLIAALFTEIPGSSDVFERGFVTYSDASKTALIGVSAELIARHGAVSAPVAEAMAQGALARSDAQLSIAVTGVAGPGGGTQSKPVGLVYLAVAAKDGGISVQQQNFPGNRADVRLASVEAALGLIMARLAPAR